MRPAATVSTGMFYHRLRRERFWPTDFCGPVFSEREDASLRGRERGAIPRGGGFLGGSAYRMGSGKRWNGFVAALALKG